MGGAEPPEEFGSLLRDLDIPLSTRDSADESLLFQWINEGTSIVAVIAHRFRNLQMARGATMLPPELVDEQEALKLSGRQFWFGGCGVDGTFCSHGLSLPCFTYLRKCLDLS
jgi:hypothetical protein